MPSLTFSTPHPFDLRALTIMGINSKPNSDNPIGYFGTGLKYAVAVLTRLGCKLSFVVDGVPHRVVLKESDFRGKEFQMLYLGSSILPFTTELGKNWDALQAYRELVTNTRDEGGHVAEGSHPEAKGLQIIVEGPAVMEAFAKHSEMFLDSPRVIEEVKGLQICEGPSTSLFYRGVAVSQLPCHAQFTYNIIEQLPLTEDRTYKESWYLTYFLGNKAIHTTSPLLLREFSLPGALLEHKLTPNEAFGQAFAEHCADAFQNGVLVNLAFGHKSMIQLGRKFRRDTIEPNPDWRAMLEQAKSILAFNGMTTDLYEIVIVEKIGAGNVQGQAHREEKTITLASTIFKQGLTCVVATLMEEYIHLRYNYDDCTRSFQDYFVTLAADLLVRLAKRNAGLGHSLEAIPPVGERTELSLTDDDIPF